MVEGMAERVLVTGSGKGIGRAIALQLAKDGFDLAIHCRSDKTSAEQVVEEVKALGQQASLLVFDVSDREAARQAIEQDIADNGAYYGAVCNAGITRDGAFPSLTEDDWDSVLQTNLGGFYNVLHPLTTALKKQRRGGRVVTIASVSGIAGNRGQVNYSASKGGVIAATKALSLELAKRKITVNCVAPGLIETDMTGELEHEKDILSMIPMRRAGKPEEVAGLVGYLFQPSAAYITRQVFSVNGGLV